ncbi:altronate dehydratase [Chryseotalea sanaruensis]|uniref:Altronate dehydratase n=1 Tax=Chryseotalea sanaruensis TaxID=2482724 RepID=A0A401U523_9BACT|nr:altronate dehydratase family protein [Chryseotalea sanaruensis]GCC50064.1 altronate dehydratase [Chryseotalea sanaruensis]
MSRVLKIHPNDNLIVALENIPAGERIVWMNEEIVVQQPVQAKHKFAANNFEVGDPLYMYGVLIGKAYQPIKKGEVITTFNVKHAASEVIVRPADFRWKAPDVSPFTTKTFDGYIRSDGKVGVANYWLVIPLVFCENRNIEAVQEALESELGYGKKSTAWDVQKLIKQYQSGADVQRIIETDIQVVEKEQPHNKLFPNVDGVKFLTHNGGCGGTRQDSEALCNLLAGYVHNANVAGATILSLGCQNAQVKIFEEAIKRVNPSFDKPLYILGQQESKSEKHFVEDSIKKTFAGLMQANTCERQPAPLGKLLVGLECGGSDGFSGISANPLLGYFSDMLTALGGSPVLAEFPELNGVEQNIVDRCTSIELAERFVSLMNVYHKRAKEAGSGFDMNPSPGNIKDGLITDAMKSAGAAKKGGTSPVTDILDYTEQITKPGLNLLCTPGNDVESTTALAGSGCTLMLFTTGLGTPTGNPITPVIKVSSNNQLTERMSDIIDVNAGTIITGEDSIESKAHALMEYVIDVASGRKETHATRLGQDDFIPWKRGVSL